VRSTNHQRLRTHRLTTTQQEDLRRLNVIHVAGTKGKESTCRFILAFLEAHHERRGVPVKICTLIGPHLLSCTERIQINGTPTTQEAFAESFSQVVKAVNRPPLRRDGPRMTQLVALTAINYAVRHGVDFFL
jgi:folylpolyglutamate synthase